MFKSYGARRNIRADSCSLRPMGIGMCKWGGIYVVPRGRNAHCGLMSVVSYAQTRDLGEMCQFRDMGLLGGITPLQIPHLVGILAFPC